MTHKLEMPLEQFAEAVAKENTRLNEHNEKLKEQTKLYFHAFNKATARIEELEAALREVLLWTDDCDECDYDDEWLDIETRARKVLEAKVPLEWTENYGQGSEPWLNKE